MDASLSIASFRKSLPQYTVPFVDYGADAPYLSCDEIIHPLLSPCVPNRMEMRDSILLTGSNASGKTTFLRTVAINLVLTQGICTAAAKTFSASCLRVFTSIDCSDSLSVGESYYVAELKSLRRIIRAADAADVPVFCCLDELLRGTNAVERLSASTEILYYLSRRCLCAASTHDAQLCAALPDFSIYHFSERLSDGTLTFDYTLKPGQSYTTNAIRLLSDLDFSEALVTRAKARAERSLTSGA